jgi:hypothetical protein
MRLLLWLPLFALTAGCGQKVDRPDSAPDCDPATMNCNTYQPAKGGSVGGGNEGSGGEDAGGSEGASISGLVVVYNDDFFDQGVAFSGPADVSAIGASGSRVEARYDGTLFELSDVRKEAGNWFLVEADTGQGMLPTITPVDTRIAKTEGYAIGLASSLTVDNLFVLLGAERSPSLAQLVVTVVDDQGRSIAGAEAQLGAEIIAYRQAGSWSEADLGTDDSGMIFLGNVQASPALSKQTIVFGGSVNARVDVQARAGAVTVVTAVVDLP